MTTTETITVAEPLPGTVKDRNGDPCPQATADSYPLRATCANCYGRIRCADGTADWCHANGSGQGRCYGLIARLSALARAPEAAAERASVDAEALAEFERQIGGRG